MHAFYIHYCSFVQELYRCGCLYFPTNTDMFIKTVGMKGHGNSMTVCVLFDQWMKAVVGLFIKKKWWDSQDLFLLKEKLSVWQKKSKHVWQNIVVMLLACFAAVLHLCKYIWSKIYHPCKKIDVKASRKNTYFMGQVRSQFIRFWSYSLPFYESRGWSLDCFFFNFLLFWTLLCSLSTGHKPPRSALLLLLAIAGPS